MITKYEDPWLYYTVDNYFPYEIFESMSESIQSFIKTGYKNLSESQNGILHTSREIMNVIGNNALSSFNRLAKEKAYSLYNIEKKDRNTYNEIKFMEAGGNYPKHDESLNKILSVVIYLNPIGQSDSLGTKIYNSEKKYHSTVEWVPNRAMIFMRQSEVSWHSYDNLTSDIRVTCNHFLIDKNISSSESTK